MEGECREKRRILDILSQNELSLEGRIEGTIAAPFYRILNFLPQQMIDKVEGIINANKDAFKTSAVVKKDKSHVNKDFRSSKMILSSSFPKIQEEFLSKISKLLPSIAKHLEIIEFEISNKELQLTMHESGDFFKLHQDSSDSTATEKRKITFVYYYHRTPKKFSGGDLLLHDTSQDKSSYSLNYTLIEPIHNSIVVFPSYIYHQVTPIQLQSNDPLDGRFTLNGWLHD